MTEHTIPGQRSQADILAYIRLSRTEKQGSVTFPKLPAQALDAPPVMSCYVHAHLVLLEPELAGRLTYDSGRQVCIDISD